MEDWRPGAGRHALQARAKLLGTLRAFFAQRDIMEVDTPLLCSYGVSDPAIEALLVSASVASPNPRYLQTSPEYAMKRLLAADSGAIYQLGKAFRDGERGRRHNPEFTLLEWYRPGFSLDELIGEVGELLTLVLGRDSFRTCTYRELFLEVLDIDPWTVDDARLEALTRSRGDYCDGGLDRDACLDLLLTHCIEPALRARGVLALRDYPPSQAALARCTGRDGREVAERFEFYVDGVEIANGYRELLDPEELQRRAAADNRRRRAAGQEPRALDKQLLAAMRAGLPDCSGVALGVDRLLMLSLGAGHLDEVLPFSWERC